MTLHRSPPALQASSAPQRWRWGAAACLIVAFVWLIGSWAIASGIWSVNYEVDMAATLLCALVLLLACTVAAWRAWQLGGDEAQASNKLWLSVLLVRREEAEQAAEVIESLCDALEGLERAWQPATDQLPRPNTSEVARLDQISPELQPVLARQTHLAQQLQSLQARLVNVQVKFGRGDPLDALAYDLQPLSDEYRQLESTLSHLFDELQAIEKRRADQLDWYRQQQDSLDPYAPWRAQLETALSQMALARTLLARSLDQEPPLRPTHIDEFLGLRP